MPLAHKIVYSQSVNDVTQYPGSIPSCIDDGCVRERGWGYNV